MPTIYFGSVAKRKNSTLQPSLSNGYNCILKESTSTDNPTFIIQDESFNINANMAKWDDRYYFIEDIVSFRNNIWEVSCRLDPMATYKSDILSSTQFVAYSSSKSSIWLPDTRIPSLENIEISKNDVTISLFSLTGCYILTVLGDDGCNSYNINSGTLQSILHDLAQWVDDIQDLIERIQNMDVSAQTAWDAVNNLGVLLHAIALAAVKTGFWGDSRDDALNCIRSCVWLPFDSSAVGGASDAIVLGRYPTGKNGLLVTNIPKSNSISISIPWHKNDWRRITNENVYLYLPFIGMISIPTEEIATVNTLTVKYSYCIDGSLSYEVLAGNEIIGTYGGNVAGDMPIGVSQAKSIGETVNTILSGVTSELSYGMSDQTGADTAGMVMTHYNNIRSLASAHNTSIGGISCSAGAGLDLFARCYTVYHPTVIEPDAMASTMGVPTQKPMSLSGLSGFCQCINAHVSAAADGPILDEIDSYLNSGFYIE